MSVLVALPHLGGSCPSRCSLFSLSAWKQLCVQPPFCDSGTRVHCCQCLCVLSPFVGPSCARAAAWSRLAEAALLLGWAVSAGCLTQQLKKSRQIEAEMMYGSTPLTPIKRRVLGPHTPGKMRKVKLCVQQCGCAGPRGVTTALPGLGLPLVPHRDVVVFGKLGEGPGRGHLCSPWGQGACCALEALHSRHFHLGFPGVVQPSASSLCDTGSAFPAAQWQFHLQRDTQQHRALSFWENHLPLAKV